MVHGRAEAVGVLLVAVEEELPGGVVETSADGRGAENRADSPLNAADLVKPVLGREPVESVAAEQDDERAEQNPQDHDGADDAGRCGECPYPDAFHAHHSTMSGCRAAGGRPCPRRWPGSAVAAGTRSGESARDGTIDREVKEVWGWK